ncbi:MAG: hypothetical protein IPL62_04335 [Caulobacteraceae bacterium]|nr:hypothetical protein [Caulobacteraceae bacterium]
MAILSAAATVAAIPIGERRFEARVETVKATVEIAAFGDRQTVAAILRFKTRDARELAAQADGFVTVQRAAANAAIDACIKLALTLVDRLPIVVAILAVVPFETNLRTQSIEPVVEIAAL